MRFTIIVTILVGFSQVSGCTSDLNKFRNNPALIDWKKEFIMNDGDQATPYYAIHKKFIEPYFNISYEKDTLIVTTLMEINSCGNSIGDIRISNDTLHLMTKNITDESCASVSFYKFTYIVENSSNKKYVIESHQ